MSFVEGMVHRFEAGGTWMIPIAVLLAVAVAIMIERIFVLFAQTRLNKEGVLNGLRARIFQGDIKGGVEFLASQPQSPLTRILKAGLLQTRFGEEEVQAAMDEASMHEMPLVEKRSGFVAMIANAATLTGLLGTVNGMISVFAAVANVSAADRATALSHGISEALNCTWFGLFAAIPCIIVYSILQARTQGIQDDIRASVASVVNMVLRHRDKVDMNGLNQGV